MSVEFELLDQTTQKLGNSDKKDTYNPKREYINKILNTLIDNKSSQVAGFTLTLKKKYHEDDPVWMHRYIHKSLQSSRIWKDKNYILFPEFTKRGVLHYHGIMWDEYQVEVIRSINWWRRKYGFVKLEKKINNLRSFLTYITKDYNTVGLWTITNKH